MNLARQAIKREMNCTGIGPIGGKLFGVGIVRSHPMRSCNRSVSLTVPSARRLAKTCSVKALVNEPTRRIVCRSGVLFEPSAIFPNPNKACLAVTHDANDKCRNPGLQKQHGSDKTDGLVEELVIRSTARCKQANPHCEQSETADSYRSRSDHAATLMFKRYGDNALKESAARADELADFINNKAVRHDQRLWETCQIGGGAGG